MIATLTHRSRRRLPVKPRGTATVEAVVVFPVLFVLFVSVGYVKRYALARQLAEQKARECAWAYSSNNCTSVPPGCENQIAFVQETATGLASVDRTANNAMGTSLGSVVTRVLKPALDLASGGTAESTTRTTYNRPSLFGGATQTARGSYHLACNLEPEQLKDVAEDAWNELLRLF